MTTANPALVTIDRVEKLLLEETSIKYSDSGTKVAVRTVCALARTALSLTDLASENKIRSRMTSVEAELELYKKALKIARATFPDAHPNQSKIDAVLFGEPPASKELAKPVSPLTKKEKIQEKLRINTQYHTRIDLKLPKGRKRKSV